MIAAATRWLVANAERYHTGNDTLLELTDGNYRLVRSAVGARRKFFEHIRTLTTYLHFESWDHLMDFLLRGLEIGPYASLRN